MSQYTKQAIVETFLGLLKEHTLDKITVKDIVETCGINRNTFYYYYKDIYDLIDSVFVIETKRVLEEERTCDTWYEELTHEAQFIVNNRTAILHIYNSKCRDVLENYLFTVCNNFIRRYVERQAAGMEVSEKDKAFVSAFYGYSFVGITLHWIKNNTHTDSEEFLHRVAAVIESTVKTALECNATIKPICSGIQNQNFRE